MTNNKVVLQDRSLAFIKEYILNNLGFSITVGNEDDPGTSRTGTNGGVGARLEYKDDAGAKWFNAVKDAGVFQVNADGNVSARELDFVRNGFVQDPTAALSKLGMDFCTFLFYKV